MIMHLNQVVLATKLMNLMKKVPMGQQYLTYRQ